MYHQPKKTRRPNKEAKQIKNKCERKTKTFIGDDDSAPNLLITIESFIIKTLFSTWLFFKAT